MGQRYQIRREKILMFHELIDEFGNRPGNYGPKVKKPTPSSGTNYRIGSFFQSYTETYVTDLNIQF